MAETTVLELVVDTPHVLFEGFESSAIRGRHLDKNAEQFILHRARETESDYTLVVRTRSRRAAFDSSTVAERVRSHFAHRADEECARLRSLVRAGWRDLIIGFAFLLMCGAIGLVGTRVLPSALGLFVEQGLLILGWVALWRPMDLFLYGLRPLRYERVILRNLSRMHVRFEPVDEDRLQAVRA